MIANILCLILFIFDVSLSYASNDTINVYEIDNTIVPRVYNGWPAKLGDVPYQVAFKARIRYPRNAYTTFCGGTIIGPRKMLSAAHCFTSDPKACEKICGSRGKVPKKMLSHKFAVAGQLWNTAIYHRDSTSEGQWRALKAVRYPPDYKFPKLDIALVFTYKRFIYDSYVNAIPFASKAIDYDGKCLVSGFGRISQNEGSDKLLLAHLTLITARQCNRMYRMKMHQFICTSSQYTDVGKGDSGGPLVCANTGDPMESSNGVLVGIVSGHRYGVGSFFTRVSSFHNYIRRNKSFIDKKSNLHLIVLCVLINWIFLLF